MKKQTKFKLWLTQLDKWRNKFTTPLTREQACEVLIDDCRYENGDFIENDIKSLYWQDFEDFAYSILDKLRTTKIKKKQHKLKGIQNEKTN